SSSRKRPGRQEATSPTWCSDARTRSTKASCTCTTVLRTGSSDWRQLRWTSSSIGSLRRAEPPSGASGERLGLGRYDAALVQRRGDALQRGQGIALGPRPVRDASHAQLLVLLGGERARNPDDAEVPATQAIDQPRGRLPVELARDEHQARAGI